MTYTIVICPSCSHVIPDNQVPVFAADGSGLPRHALCVLRDSTEADRHTLPYLRAIGVIVDKWGWNNALDIVHMHYTCMPDYPEYVTEDVRAYDFYND